MKNIRQKNIERAVVETLEGRSYLSSAYFSDGVLTLVGDSNATNYFRVVVGRNGKVAYGLVNNSVRSVLVSRLKEIHVVGSDSPNAVILDDRLKQGVKVQTGAGDDTIWGGGANDTILSGAGNDAINGRAGNDVINGGIGRDSMNGGGGQDTVISGNSPDPVGNPAGDGQGSTPNVTPTPSPKPTPVPNPTPTPQKPSTDNVPTNDPLAPKPVITLMSDTVMAGSGVHVNGLESKLGSGSLLDAKFNWDFGDDGAHSQLTGWNAGHVYDKAGTYAIKLTITNSQNKTVTISKNVTVTADTRKTIYVDAVNGNDNNSGLSANQAVRTVGQAGRMLGDNTRMLLKRGQTFDVSASVNLGYQNVMIDAYGTGKGPVMRWVVDGDNKVMLSTKSNSRDITIQNVTFDSKNLNGTSEWGMMQAIAANGQNVTVRGCTFLNVGYAINANGSPKGLIVMDNDAPLETGVRGYFTWFEGSDGVFVGNTVANVTREHVVRMTYYDRVLFSDNDFTNLDRRKQGDASDYAKGSIVAQAGDYVYVTNNKVSDGGIGIGPLGADNAPKQDRTHWAVVENNSAEGAEIAVLHGAEHVMIRGNYVQRNNTASIRIQGYDDTYQRGVTDVFVQDNLAVDYGDYGNFLKLEGKANGITLNDNTFYAPNLTAGDGDHAAVNVYDYDLGSFRQIDGNKWMMKASTLVSGSYLYVWKGWSGNGLLTMDQWNAKSQVGTDSSVDLTKGSSVDVGTLIKDFGAKQV
ncbi:MAG: PKD domain-containing protein [Phycisphaerales bacterium]|nr:PKD domain-containing protein [Phycisphaerales bacterium]